MINPEKILGGLLKMSSKHSGALGKIGHSSKIGKSAISKSAVGLGLLGVAMAAAEHYLGNKQGGATTTPPSQTPPQSFTTAPPPPPGPSAPPPPAPPSGPAQGQRYDNALLLIRSMIAAAHADSILDAEERGRILEKLKAVQLSAEEHSFISQELLSPCSLKTIITSVADPEVAKQVYAVSLMTIAVDTPAERDYMVSLANGLGLDNTTRDAIHRDLGVAPL